MPLFISNREKRLWLYTFFVLVAVFSTLIVGNPLVGILGDQNLQAVFFLMGMMLVGATILVHGLKIHRKELVTWLGIIAVYLMFFLRLGLSERSHLIEYSVLAIFIHLALMERFGQGKKILKAALIALTVTFLIGVIDEWVQKYLPNRVFDTEDILFNGLAALMAIGSSLSLHWARRRFSK